MCISLYGVRIMCYNRRTGDFAKQSSGSAGLASKGSAHCDSVDPAVGSLPLLRRDYSSRALATFGRRDQPAPQLAQGAALLETPHSGGSGALGALGWSQHAERR